MIPQAFFVPFIRVCSNFILCFRRDLGDFEDMVSLKLAVEVLKTPLVELSSIGD